MTIKEQHELGKTLWRIADDLRGSMMADDFRDYMLSFLFLRYLSDNYIEAAITLPIQVERYLALFTFIPAASAVAGFSPTARRFNP